MKTSDKLIGASNRIRENNEPYSSFSKNDSPEYPFSSSTQALVYQCPMKCEGEKTYNAPGNCPVCNMHLEPVNEAYF